MANYLPVLLVSVAANSIPDDSSVSTLPRGQVDYLSHNWEEEDVWRSWRNMTRQKNEITNGVRLENASWRTWWKQRNGLGTVTPETLNWLKDSDVTWLYGPLHTAVDWTPPPKPIPEPTSALDLSTTHKPILKYRSISQLLTSDLHTSPHLSPPQSDADLDDFEPTTATTTTPSPDTRPPLTHTKSDTHITRWGPSRAFRKESPPRIDPPPAAYSPTSLDAFFASSSGENSSSNTSATARAASPSVAGGQQKKRHISFNTFVEQCIAIEKPKNRVQYRDDDDDDDDEDDDGPDSHEFVQQSGRYPYGGRTAWGYDDGYEEDEEADSGDEEEEAVSLSMWDERYGGSAIANSDSDSYDGHDDDEPIEDDDDDNTLSRRSPFRAANTTSARSVSKVSTASSSSTASTSTSLSSASSASTSTSSSSGARERRSSTSTTSTYRPRITQPRRRRAPPLIRTPTTEREPTAMPTHVTIAPIAPTILKTGGGVGEWVEGLGDEAGGSDDGLLWGGAGTGGARWWAGAPGVRSEPGGEGEDETGGESRESGTPVELVYVPPFGSNYSVRLGRDRERDREREREYGARREVREVMEDHEDGLGNGARGMYRSASDQGVYPGEVQAVYGGSGGRTELGPRRRRSLFSVGVAGDDEVDPDTEPPVVIPTVVVPREDAFECFDGADRGRRARGRGREPFGSPGDRSRSRSKSRTPSPAVSPSTSIDAAPVVVPTPIRAHTIPAPTSSSTTTAPVAVPGLRRAASASPPITASALLAPPARGRGSSSHQDLGQTQGRGRSSTRAPSASGSLSTAGSSSSLGSLSPEGIVAGVGGGKDRDRDGRGWRETRSDGGRDGGRDRERSRGRDRTGKRLSTSVSPDEMLVPTNTAASSPTPPSPPRLNIVTKSASEPPLPSSSSSASSTSSSTTAMPATPAPMYRPVYVSDNEPVSATTPVGIPAAMGEEEKQRYMHPTPSNSPVISMHAQTAPKSSPNSKATPTKHTAPNAGVSAAKAKSPLSVPAHAHPAEPSTSYSTSPSPPRARAHSPSPSSSASPRTSAASSSSVPTSPESLSGPYGGVGGSGGVGSPPSSPVRGEATIVGKAVGMVSSAGAFLGLWNGGL